MLTFSCRGCASHYPEAIFWGAGAGAGAGTPPSQDYHTSSVTHQSQHCHHHHADTHAGRELGAGCQHLTVIFIIQNLRNLQHSAKYNY